MFDQLSGQPMAQSNGHMKLTIIIMYLFLLPILGERAVSLNPKMEGGGGVTARVYYCHLKIILYASKISLGETLFQHL